MPKMRIDLGLSGLHWGEGIGLLRRRVQELDEHAKTLLKDRRQLSINISAYSNEVSHLLKGTIAAEVSNDMVIQ